MTQKDFVVSADGHLLEPIDLFKTRLPEHLRDLAVWEEEFEIEPFVEGGARVFRKLHTPGLRGLDGLALPPDERADARGRPRASSSRTWTSTASTPRCCTRTCRSSGSSPTTTRCRSRTPASTTTTSSSGSRRTSTGWRRPRPSRSPTSATPSPRSSGSPPAGSGRCCCRPPRRCRTTRRELDPVWAAIQGSGMSVFVHTQTGGIKVNDPEALTLKVMMENAQQVNQPMTEKMAAEADGHPGGHAADRPADSSSASSSAAACPSASPTCTSRSSSSTPTGSRRSSAPWTSAGSPASARTPTGGSACGTTPAPTTTSPAWPSCSGSTRSGRTRSCRASTCKRQFHVSFQDDPGRRRLPAHHRPVDDHVGQRLPARRGHVPRQPGAAADAVGRRPRRRAQGDGRRHARRPPRLRGLRPVTRPELRAPTARRR